MLHISGTKIEKAFDYRVDYCVISTTLYRTTVISFSIYSSAAFFFASTSYYVDAKLSWGVCSGQRRCAVVILSQNYIYK